MKTTIEASKSPKRWVELMRVAILPMVYWGLVITERNGMIDHWRGLDLVKAVADNFSLSYAPDASKPVYPEDAAWKPLINLIQEHFKVKLRPDKEPQTVARFAATLSTKEEAGNNLLSEWTSPSTPFVVFYRHWPENTGKTIPPEDSTTVGTIGDLQNWIVESKSDFHFFIHDVVLGILALLLGYSVWHMNHLQRS